MQLAAQLDGEQARNMLARYRCLLLSIALLPVMTTLADIAARNGASQWNHAHIYLDHLFSSSLVGITTILIWRKFVVWTFARVTITAASCLILYAQLIYGLSLYDSIWVESDSLQMAQSRIVRAFWLWLMAWTWWSNPKAGSSAPRNESNCENPMMNSITKRVAASVGLIPATTGVAYLAYAPLRESWYSHAESVTNCVGSVFIICAWCLLWRRFVPWSRGVVLRTLGIILLCHCVPIALSAAGKHYHIDILLLAGLPYLGWGLWLALTMWIWPLKPFAADAEDGPKCLKCGYSLRGLSTTRCPECGDEPTLDALWAGQAT